MLDPAALCSPPHVFYCLDGSAIMLIGPVPRCSITVLNLGLLGHIEKINVFFLSEGGLVFVRMSVLL